MVNLLRFSIVPFFVFIIIGVASAQDDPTVYVTKTGSKYHTSGCSYLGKSSISIKLSEVGTRYSPCSRCKPPVLKTAITKSEQTGNDAKSPKATEKNTSETQKQTKDEKTVGTTSSGKTIYEGPRGGKFHYSKSGKKVYEKKKK